MRRAAAWGALVALCALVAGCAGLGGVGLFRPGVGDHSFAVVELDEQTAAGDKTRITIKSSGEASTKAGVEYVGESGGDVVTPWRLSMSGDQAVTSPQAGYVAAGYAEALKSAPATIGELAAQIGALAGMPDPGDAVPGAPSLRDTVIRVLLERFAARFAPGG